MTEITDALLSERKAVQALMQAGRFGEALTAIDGALASSLGDVELLYMGVASARYAKAFDRATDYLARLKTVQPEFGRAFQEEGHLLRDQGQFEAALGAYRRACQYNGALIASWTAQAGILKQLGRTESANAAEAQASRLKALPKHLLAVTNHLAEGRILKAEDLCRAFLKAHPHHVEAMRLLAEIGTQLGVLEDADLLLEAAVGIAPDNIQLRLDYIQVLRKRQKFVEALAQARALYERDPGNPLFLSHFAIETMQTGDYDTALELFGKVLETLPDDPATQTSRGHALKTAGRQADAIGSYKAAIAARGTHGDAWYALANLKTYVFEDGELAQMQAVAGQADLSHMDRVHIAFALGKAFEDRKAYDDAFAQYALGNGLKSAQSRYTSAQMQAELEAQKVACPATIFADPERKGYAAPDPIFIVGLPRAGSTLIEQILASHSQVDGTLELPDILSLAHRLRGRKHVSEAARYPDVLAELSADDLSELGENYVETTRIHRQGAPFFTDKMPNNFRHLGLIHLILPNAKIIDARRAPMDCCWSGFKQLFAEGQEFTYALEDIGHYYRAYVDLMDHWERVLPAGTVLRVQHEDVLDDLEGQVRRILSYCGLPFEKACLDFHQTRRAVRTASSEQVRQPISRAGQDQWRPFAHHLGPLKKALGKELVGGV